MFPFREIMRFMVSELWITVPKMNYALRFYLRVNLKATAPSGLWECRNYSVLFCPFEKFVNGILCGISFLSLTKISILSCQNILYGKTGKRYTNLLQKKSFDYATVSRYTGLGKYFDFCHFRVQFGFYGCHLWLQRFWRPNIV